MDRPILVTGASGFAGSHLLDLLAAGPERVVAWRRPGRLREGRSDIVWESVDILDPEAVNESIARLQPSAVYHCAGEAHVGRAWEHSARTFAANVRGTHHLIEALRAWPDVRVLIPSSAMVYAPTDEPLREDSAVRPSSPYGLSKLAQEMVAFDGGAAPGARIARAFNHFGPRQNPIFSVSGFARRIAEIELGRVEPEIAVGNLDARRDLTDVRDTVRAYRAIVERGRAGCVYNVCSGRALQIGELLDLLLARARVHIRVKVDPARYRPNDSRVIVGDPRRIQVELDWAPAIATEQSIEDILSFWRHQITAVS
jgi:GDP-4-dehydro-6-deoxy-D-mannose reductase